MLLILGPNKKFKERKSFADPRIIDHEGNDTILGVSFRLSSQSNPDSFKNSHLRHVLLIIFHNHKWNAQSCKITITACEVENFIIDILEGFALPNSGLTLIQLFVFAL